MIPKANLVPINAREPHAMCSSQTSVSLLNGATEMSKFNHFLILPSSTTGNPQRVSEAVHESSARINVIVPGHPDSLPGGGRITPIIYVGGGQAELNSFPLREIVRFVQGIVLFKEKRFSK